MTHKPRTTDSIYESLRDSLIGKITKLTNFTERSFNYVWARAFSRELRELEVRATVSELAGWIDYTGGPVTESDLETLGIDENITAEEVEEIMQEDYLDEYVKILGVERLPGTRSTGSVTFTTQSGQTDIQSGTRVTTSPDSEGETIDFLTTEDASTADGVTTVSDVPIQAEEIGADGDVPAETIIRLAEPPLGVKGVSNNESTTGGSDREGNEELRARSKKAVQSSSLGGTVDGIKGYLRQNVEGVGEGDIIIDEFTDSQPPYADVIVDGGLDSEVDDAIQFSRPAAIRHDLVRPEIIQLGFDLNLRGTDIETTNVSDDITDFLLNLGIGSDFFEDEFIRIVMESDSNIINIDELDGYIERVTNETKTYDSSVTDYELNYTYDSTYGNITIEEKDGTSYVEGTDFTVEDQTGDGYLETIVWLDVATPDDGDDFFVDYDVTVPDKTLDKDSYSTNLVRDEVLVFNLGETDTFEYNDTELTYQISGAPFDGTVSIEDELSNIYYKNVDWQLAPLLDKADEDTITYSSTTNSYSLSEPITIDEMGVIDDDGNIFIRGSDYITTDSTGDGLDDTIDWEVDIDGAIADDGGTTTDETTAANNSTADDMTLLPTTPAVDDAYYFGQDTIFGEFDLNVSTAGDGTWDIVWEYYNGTNWVALSGVTDGTNDFRTAGINNVSWTIPNDWSTTSVGGIGGLYYVRGRVDTYSSITTQPLGQEVEVGQTPANSTDFTVNYNGYARSIRWDVNNSSPSQGDNFTVTFDQKLYSTEYDIIETLKGEIRDESGDVYEEDVDYDLADCFCDGELSAILWSQNPATLDDNEEFYFSYLTEGDIHFEQRQKADPGTIETIIE